MKAPLDQLHDILPGPDIGFFSEPIAIVISCITIVFITYLIYKIIKVIPVIKFRHQAKKDLRVIYKTQNENFIPFINLLLKKIASRYWHREQFAGLHTQEWLYFLDAYSKCSFSKYSEKWEAWSYSCTTLSANEKKDVYQECIKWLNATSKRRPL